jgi:hypothetical protein
MGGFCDRDDPMAVPIRFYNRHDLGMGLRKSDPGIFFDRGQIHFKPI